MKTTIRVAIILILSLSVAHAQKETYIEPTFITIADGLVSQSVNSVIQDSYGLIWIATNNGLQRYDGLKFETFKTVPGKETAIHHNMVWDLFEDEDHNIWCATEYGVSRYDRKKNEFVNFTFGSEVGIAAGSGRTIHFFYDSQKRLWANNAAVELLRYDRENDKWVRVLYADGDIAISGGGTMSLGLTEDTEGGLWLGSGASGLMYYAKNDSGFRKVKTDLPFTGDSFITSLYSESPTSLYITTLTSVYKYNPKTNTTKTIETTSDGRYWNSIKRDKDGNIWIMNNAHGILKFSQNSDTYEKMFIKGAGAIVGTGYNYEVTDFTIDRSGIFWIGSVANGLIKYDPSNKPFRFLLHNPDISTSIASGGVFGVYESKVKPGIVYVGSRGFGYQLFDRDKQTFEKITFKTKGERFPMYARSFSEDDDGTLWVGSWEDGLLKFDKNNREIARYAADGKPGSISNDQVRILRKSGNGKLLVGTNAGLNTLDIASGKFKRFMTISTKQYPKALLDELSSLITSSQSLGLIDKVKASQNKSVPVEIKTAGKYIVVSAGEGDGASLADYGWIENAAKEKIWVFSEYKKSFYSGGSPKNRVAVDVIDLQPGSYTLHYTTDDSHSYDGWNEPQPDQISLWGIALIKPKDQSQTESIQRNLDPKLTGIVLSGNNIFDICIGKKYTWIASLDEGLTRLDLSDSSTRYYFFDPKDNNTISSNTTNGVYEDPDGKTLWLATNEGLNRLDIETEKFTRYSEAEGLPTNALYQIIPGNKNELWISTGNGLSQMLINESIDRVTFINYNSTDGLGGNSFTPRAAMRTSDGEFFFGGEHGLTMFRGIQADTTPPGIIITKIMLSNKTMDGDVLSAKEIDLSFDQNNLSFEFAALHYANPKKNQLAHKLDGYDKDWIYDNRNFASYTNLDPGTYTLRIRASNSYGIWNEEGIALKIVISPPWWRTWWAYGSYVLIFGLVAFQGNKEMRRNIKRRERERSREKELAQAKEIEKAYTNLKATQAQLVISEKMASLGELTAGIAHEIQNPLNFVNNFSEINKELIEEMKAEISAGNLDEAKSIADTIAENESKIIYHGKRADGIVKGMLQHSRTSSGQKEAADINALSDEYLRLAYHGLRAKDKSFNATMKTDFDTTLGKINVIPQDLGRVILNLITNAFYVVAERKANSAPGTYEPTVSVSTKRIGDKVQIRVTDNGKGIPAAIIDKIFQPFFTTKPSGQGTGLGLSLSYEIVTKGHGGELKVDTKEGEGTTFTIIIPA